MCHDRSSVSRQVFCQDMTLRDYAQGAYRMRGIGQGSHLMEFQVRSLNVFGKVSMT